MSRILFQEKELLMTAAKTAPYRQLERQYIQRRSSSHEGLYKMIIIKVRSMMSYNIPQCLYIAIQPFCVPSTQSSAPQVGRFDEDQKHIGRCVEVVVAY